MKNVFDYEGYKFNKGSVTKVTDPLTVEAPLQININSESYTVVMQTPGDEIELSTGLLYSENVIKDFSKIEFEIHRNKLDQIEIINLVTTEDNLADGYLNSRSLLSVSSCGICGKRELSDIKTSGLAIKKELKTSFDDLFEMQKTMLSKQDLFNKTGGCHGVALFNNNRELLTLKEDIGRHNALDKSIGQLILNDQLKQASFVIFSGRISYEIVSKAFRAKIPIIAAVSSPSSLAIDFAKEYGMTLIGFCRENKGTCYSNPKRLNF